MFRAMVAAKLMHADTRGCRLRFRPVYRIFTFGVYRTTTSGVAFAQERPHCPSRAVVLPAALTILKLDFSAQRHR
jgi:hypothetical protein